MPSLSQPRGARIPKGFSVRRALGRKLTAEERTEAKDRRRAFTFYCDGAWEGPEETLQAISRKLGP